jgi:hypothetical protein
MHPSIHHHLLQQSLFAFCCWIFFFFSFKADVQCLGLQVVGSAAEKEQKLLWVVDV